MAVSDRALCAGEVTLDRAGMRLREGVVLCPLAAALPDCVARDSESGTVTPSTCSANPLQWRQLQQRPWRWGHSFHCGVQEP